MKLFNKFIKNAEKPDNTFLGRMMLKGMNKGHNKMALDCIDNFIKLKGHEDVLDIGCGGGQNIANFLDRTKGKVCGIDLSSASVDASIKKNKKGIRDSRCEIVEGNVLDIPFADNSFDVVTAFEAIYFWQDLDKAFQEIKRVLKPFGRFIICNGASSEEVYKKWTKVLDMNIYTSNELKDILQKSGFTKIISFPMSTPKWLSVEGINNKTSLEPKE